MGGTLRQAVIRNQYCLPDELVVDATGAGDTLTGMLLAVSVSPMLQIALGARLGMAVATAKLAHSGPLSDADLHRTISEAIGDLTMGFMDETANRNRKI